MRLKKNEREFFRKLLENFIVKNPQFKQCQVVDHFEREGITRQTVYNALNRRKNGQSILGIEDYAREKTPKYTEEQTVKAKNGAVNLLIFYINRRRK